MKIARTWLGTGWLVAATLAAAPASAQFGALPSAPAAVNTNAGTDGGSPDASSRLATDGAGLWVCVWTTGIGPYGADYDILVARSTDDGVTWSPPMPLNTTAATDGSSNDFMPELATDGAGTWVTVWVSDNTLGGTIGSDQDVLFARSTDGGVTWTVPLPLNSNAAIDSTNDTFATIAASGPGVFVAAWAGTYSGGSDQDVLFARSTNGGASFGALSPLNANAASDLGADYNVHLAGDGSSSWIAVWESNEDLGGAIGTDWDILFARSSNDGSSWTAPASLKTSAGSDGAALDGAPRVATDRLGNWLCVWRSTDTLAGSVAAESDVLCARSKNGGSTWSAPAFVNTNAATDSGEDWEAHIATDRHGNWIVAWESTENLGGTIGTDWDLLVARSTIAGGSWSAPEILNSNAATDSGHDLAPCVATDRHGHWTAVWASTDSLGGTIGSDQDILCTRFTLPETTASGFCYGDGSAGACPCNNNSLPGAREGCRNSSGNGARLVATGNPYVPNNTVTLHADQLPGSVTHIYLQGTAATVPGLIFGDGRRCTTGPLKRLATYSGVGSASSVGHSTGVNLVVAGSIPPFGGTYVYQVWYRNGVSMLCSPPNSFNISGGLTFVWYP